jgi:hypothetical protein
LLEGGARLDASAGLLQPAGAHEEGVIIDTRAVAYVARVE